MVVRFAARLVPALLILGLAADATAAEEPSGAEPTLDGRPVVIVLSMDGVRHDQIDREGLPAFERMIREGLRAERLRPVFPAVTFPNHVALATGAPVDRHGIVANEFHDRKRGDFRYANDASWIEAEPLWVAAERQGVTSASFFWVGSETDWQGVGARYRKSPFDSEIGEDVKVDQILAWLDLPAAERPGLVMSWWHGADSAGHRAGPDAERTTEQLRSQDRELARLLAGLDERHAWVRTTLIVVSDHGMVSVADPIDPWAALDEAGIEARLFATGGLANVYLDDAADLERAVATLGALEDVTAYTAETLPERLRYRHPSRIGDVVILTKPPRFFLESWTARAAMYRAAWLAGLEPGRHGYDPDGQPDLHGIFLALGRGVAPGTRIGTVSALDVAPTVATLLGIDPPRDAEGSPLAAIAPPR
ncbi:MAG: ectonucleotide pyrophosphatase/phosphodiesterase [Proteobacteria bacterium]|nr:ectonucleotide pyrophosphatase/phosphodiesterase [Pseudomonadota bacterium]